MSQSGLAAHPFSKWNGLGNDFVILDLRGTRLRPSVEEARAIADRETGIGCDQLITIEDKDGADAFMGVWNPDGSEVGACGNAARCVGWIVAEALERELVCLKTKSGPISARVVGDRRVSVDMGAPRLDWRDIPLSEQMNTKLLELQLGPIDAPVLHSPSAVNMGNPHCVFFVDDAEAQDIERFGPLVENHPLFPERANVSVAEVRSPNEIRVRVWERGAGVTQACGTAACAVAVAAVRRRRADRQVTIQLDGGPLEIEWRESDQHVIMTGPVAHEFDGELGADLFASK